MRQSFFSYILVLAYCWAVLTVRAQSPGIIHYQGRILSGATVFDGTGQFKFSLVNADGSQTFWRNAPDANTDGEPDQAVSLSVNRGLYSVNLGDTALANMGAIPTTVFTSRIGGLQNDPLYLRVWFNDGTAGMQRLSPDQRISAVAFAMVAASVPDGSITAAKLAAGAIQAGSITGTLAPVQIPDLDAVKISSGTLDAARLPANVALKNPDLQNLSSAMDAKIASLQSQVNTLSSQIAVLGGGSGTPGGVLVSTDPADAALTGLGYARFSNVAAPAWGTGSADNAASARYAHTAVWLTGTSEVFVWGGAVGGGIYSGTGALYSPATDTWRTAQPTGAPEARRGHTMIWNGTLALVWGGFSANGFLNSGASFNPATFTWNSLPAASPAPSGRDGHVAVWFAPYMLVWGGRDSAGARGDGALYHAQNSQWSALTLVAPPSARSGATAVAGTDRVLIWGGSGASGPVKTGKQLIFQTSPTVAPLEWRAISELSAPSERFAHTAVMAGTKMIIWGGRNGGILLGDGGIYDTASDSWQPVATAGAPLPRADHVAVWTGQEMVIFGGETASGSASTGGAFNPTTGRWRTLTSVGGPLARSGAAAVWTGAEMAVFGGQSGGLPVAALQRLTPQPDWYFYRKL